MDWARAMDIAQGEAWKPLQVLVWIASRDSALTQRFNGVHFVEDAECAVILSRGQYCPNPISMAEAFSELRRRHSFLAPLQGNWLGREFGSIENCNIFDFNIYDMLFSPGDVMRLWPTHRSVRALHLAIDRPLRRPAKSAASWAKQLPNRELLTLGQVLDAVVLREGFGSNDLVDEQAAQFSACFWVLAAAASGKIRLYGAPCRRSIESPQRLEEAESRIEIEAPVAATLSPVLDGERDWLGPSEYAHSFELNGHAPSSVRFCRVVVDRKSLLECLSKPLTPKLSDLQIAEELRVIQRAHPGMGIDKMALEIKKRYPSLKPIAIRVVAKDCGIEGRRGRPKKIR
jgi:hypothetical protein